MTFGAEGAAWHWQDGGTVEVAGQAAVALHDLTGFEGRCDAVLFCKDLDFQPPNDLAALGQMRRELLGLPKTPETADATIWSWWVAASQAPVRRCRPRRLGLTVALVQDRPVLGGNGSSEVRVWPEGWIRQQPYPHIGDVVAELVPKKDQSAGNAKSAAAYADRRKLALVLAERRITLLLEQRCNGVEAKGNVIRAVVCQHIRTARRVRIEGRWFADCTGDGAVGFYGWRRL